MAIDQEAILEKREEVKGTIARLSSELKANRALYKELNLVSALIDAAEGNGGSVTSDGELIFCTRKGCKRADKGFTTQAGYSRHMSTTHGRKAAA